MKFKEILNRVTGLSFPIFGVSWNPTELEVTKARRVITFLEDRRVLFYPRHHEFSEHCIKSILEIRHFLTEEIFDLSSDSKLAQSLRAMRAACRKFLNEIGDTSEEGRVHRRFSYTSPSNFYTALGELRGVFGIHLALIAGQYGLDIEDDLDTMLPAREAPDKPLETLANQQTHSALEGSETDIQGQPERQGKGMSKKKKKSSKS